MPETDKSTRTRVEETINDESVTTRDKVEWVTEIVTVAQARAYGAQVRVSVGPPPGGIIGGVMAARTVDMTPEAARAFAALIVEAAAVADDA